MILHLLLFLIAAFLLLFWSGSISFCFDWLELFSGKATGVHLRLYLPSVSISQRRRPKKTFTSRHDTIFILQLELHPLLSFSGAPLWDSSVVSALTCKCHLTWLWPTCCSKPTLVFYLQSVSLSDSEWGEYAQFTNPIYKLVVLEVSFFVNEAERVCGESQTAAGLPLITLAVISFALVVFSD